MTGVNRDVTGTNPLGTEAKAAHQPLTSPIIRHASRWLEDLPASPVRWLLIPFWLPWCVVLAARAAWYALPTTPRKRLRVPVISIGNLTAGGTGKTPMALAVVAALRTLGRNPTILSRGYRGVDGINDEARLAGDIPVICNPDRHAGGVAAIAAGADCVVLDDGFQHRRLHRDLDIVVIDATRPWGRDDGKPGAILPLGYQREGRSALRRAGLLWLTRTDLISPQRLHALMSELSGLAPIVCERATAVTLCELAALGPGKPAVTAVPGSQPIAAWRGRKVILACGLGHPGGFELLAQTYGLNVVARHRFPDHYHYHAGDAAMLARAAQQADAALVITSKDAVKLQAFTALFPAHTAWVLHVSSPVTDPLALMTALTPFRQELRPPRGTH